MGPWSSGRQWTPSSSAYNHNCQQASSSACHMEGSMRRSGSGCCGSRGRESASSVSRRNRGLWEPDCAEACLSQPRPAAPMYQRRFVGLRHRHERHQQRVCPLSKCPRPFLPRSRSFVGRIVRRRWYNALLERRNEWFSFQTLFHRAITTKNNSLAVSRKIEQDGRVRNRINWKTRWG